VRAAVSQLASEAGDLVVKMFPSSQPLAGRCPGLPGHSMQYPYGFFEATVWNVCRWFLCSLPTKQPCHAACSDRSVAA
jgi:hypothetical protein